MTSQYAVDLQELRKRELGSRCLCIATHRHISQTCQKTEFVSSVFSKGIQVLAFHRRELFDQVLRLTTTYIRLVHSLANRTRVNPPLLLLPSCKRLASAFSYNICKLFGVFNVPILLDWMPRKDMFHSIVQQNRVWLK